MVEIIKASGEKEKFNKDKLYSSLMKLGVGMDLAKKIRDEVAKLVKPDTSTEDILKLVLRHLKREDHLLAVRYNLKRAIMDLGPAGYAFEKYIARVLKEYGYSAQVGRMIAGHCVTHEVDIAAAKGDKRFMIECKYHNSRGIKSDLKVAMYTFARFRDLEKQFNQPLLITNTKCTTQAIKYARCVGLKIISWSYPEKESLEQLIEGRGLYPVTILPRLSRYAKENLARVGVILAKDLLKYPAKDLAKLAGLQESDVRRIQQEVRELCFY